MTNCIHKKSYGKPNVFKNLTLGNCSYVKAVFAAEHIKIYETILEFGGDIVSAKALPYPYEPEKDYFLQIGEDLYLGPSGGIDDYVNHSCNPNAGIRITANAIKLIAISSIQLGDQIAFNYSTTMDSNWGELHCACGSETCCGVVKKFIELPPLIQKTYIEHDVVPDYILEKLKNI